MRLCSAASIEQDRVYTHTADSVLMHASQNCPALSSCHEGFAVVHLQARHFRTTAGRLACMLLQASKVGRTAAQ